MNSLIISNQRHPLYEKLKSLDSDFLDYAFVQNKDLSPYELVWDLTSISTEKKKELHSLIDSQIIAEVSTCSSEDFQSNVIGGLNLTFFSPTDCYEYFSKDAKSEDYILKLLKSLEFTGIKTSERGIGLTLPRVISQIINEAYFSLEDELASREDIDTAMKFGVNYPLGPLEWSEKIGLENIAILLNELHMSTGDDRYLPSKLITN